MASTLIGYAVFLALNSSVSPALANTFNYAAPVIALLLSALLLHEPLTLVKIVAGAIALLGVALMIDRKTVATATVSVPPKPSPPNSRHGFDIHETSARKGAFDL